jgi:TctA family transporter
METLQHLMVGFGVALSAMNLGVAAFGSLVGTIVGMLPGLGPINGVAILMPLAFALKLPPETALILLSAVYLGCEFGGRISSILLNVPGDAGAIMTALDGHPMALKGMGGVALSISAWSSFVGTLVAFVGIVLFAPLLARWALAFGPAEYFALMCFAFACIAGLMGDAPMKAAIAAVIGLSLSTVGLDSNSGVYRFTGGDVHLSDGIQFIVVVIGVFSVSEILLMLEKQHSTSGVLKVTGRTLFSLKEMAMTTWGTLRSAVLGFVVGVLPGAGATIASAMAYTMEKRLNDTEGSFGKGRHPRRVCARSGQQCLGHRQLCAHADAGRAGLGHDGGDGGCAVPLQHHARAGVIQPAARTGVGPDRLFACCCGDVAHHQHPAGGPVCEDPAGAQLDAGAGHPGHQRRRCLRRARHHLRPGADDGNRPGGLSAAQARCADGAADPGFRAR